ncbi:MAG: tetratricopeptide repeat protein, partial [Hyphomicrobiales bacterium]
MQQTFETLHPQAFHPPAALALPTFGEIEDSIALWSERDPRLAALFAQGAPPVKALRFFGLKLWEEGRNDFAVEVLLAAASLAPGEAVLWNDIAGACYAASRREDAAASMTASLARNGAQPRGWLFLAMIHNDGQEFAAAEQAYLQALALDPGLADASFGLGLLCFRQRRFEEAVTRMRKAISQGNETLAARACLGQALYLLGDFSAAAEAFAMQASLSPA